VLEEFRAGTFEPLVGSGFALTSERGVELELTAVSPTGNGFALLFVGPVGIALSQGTYEVSSAELGTFPLFLVPVGIDEHGRQYEAVFTRLP